MGNVSSIAGMRASVLAGSSYCASKFGMNALGNSINLEESENGIRCTNICPVGDRHRDIGQESESPAARGSTEDGAAGRYRTGGCHGCFFAPTSHHSSYEHHGHDHN